MAELDDDGRKLLRLLVSRLDSTNTERPDRMLGYKEVHDLLGLKNIRGDWGASLKAQGLMNLADWTHATGRPAITGIIVNKEDHSPGQGYFALFGRQNGDWNWWREQVALSKQFDWSGHVNAKKEANTSPTLRSELAEILGGYEAAQIEVFKTHELAARIRDTLPQVISNYISDNGRYKVKGSPGQGAWAQVPWAAILDRLVTETAQDGYYVVYLFKSDLSGVYLSLNQGVTSIKEQYGSGAHEALRARANDFLSRLGTLASGLTKGPIDLSIDEKTSLSSYYESGAICSIFYPVQELPAEERLRNDLMRFVVLYADLASKEDRLFNQAEVEEDEAGLGVEDLRALREHKRIERNRSLSKKAKKFHGHVCKACGFDFSEKYGSIGEGFIEAHHLTPLSSLKGQVVNLSPEYDFTVLCSNCHRMIHKTETVGSVHEFRAKYIAH